MTANVPVGQALDQAREVEAWKDTAAMHHRNEQYYRGLVVRIGQMFGEAAYIADDGGRADDVLCAKVPELVEPLMDEVALSRIGFARADGALADAATVPTGDLERGIRALTAERDGLKCTLEMWAAECGEGGPRPIKADGQALAEALETSAHALHSYLSHRQPFDQCSIVVCLTSCAALARAGVRRGREKGTTL